MELLTLLDEKLARVSVLSWVRENRIVTEKGLPLGFSDRRFLIDILEDFAPVQAVQKCSQVGLTTLQIVKSIYVVKMRRLNVIYTLPTRDLVSEFNTTKADPILEKNPVLAPTGTDSVGAKVYDGGYILYRGTFGERQQIMVSSDLNIHDEHDRSNLAVIEGLESRLQASNYRGRWYFSNPSAPNVGINKLWNDSDQKHWFIRCPACRHWQFLNWPDSVDIERREFICVKCRRTIDDETRRCGRWVQKWRNRDISGYWISHLMAPWISAADIIKASEKSGDYFYNFVLGLPYLGGAAKITRALILRNLSAAAENDGKKACMGVDQGKVYHCVIGNQQGIFRLVEAKDWGEVAGLIRQYDVRCCVVDGLPEREEAAKLQKQFPGKVYLNFYVDDPKRPRDLDPVDRSRDAEGILLAERTQIIDQTIRAWAAGDILITPHDPVDPEQLEEFAKHWQALYEVRSDDNMGNEIRRWENSGPDHWAHATIYWRLAIQLFGGDPLPAIPGKEE